jgi:hypothetical protein
LNLNSTWDADEARSLQFKLTTSLAYSEQLGFFQELLGRADLWGLTRATLDSTVAIGTFGTSSYLNQTTIDGRPLNLYSRLEGKKRMDFGGWSSSTFFGAEGRYDRNFGEGRQFDPINPPRQNFSAGDRPRSFRNIPGLGIFSAYLDERLTGTYL